MINYIDKETAIAMLMAGLLRARERKAYIAERLSFIEKHIPDGYNVNEGLIKFALGDQLFNELKALHLKNLKSSNA